MSRLPFSYDAGPDMSRDSLPENPPQLSARTPFWLLKLLKKVIRHGGFLTEKVFVPKLVWSQDGAKIAGLGVKTPAYEQIIISITAIIYPVEMPEDEETAQIALAALQHLSREIYQIQNNLSKPFPFIKESISSPSVPAPSPRGRSATAINAVGLLGKNVVKYAETQVQRIGAALMYTKTTSDELQSFGNLASELCERCLVLDEWIFFVEEERSKILQESSCGGVTYLDNIRLELFRLSAFLRDVVCELLLRDTEQLLDRYLTKSRKSFARMYWDGIVEDEN